MVTFYFLLTCLGLFFQLLVLFLKPAKMEKFPEVSFLILNIKGKCSFRPNPQKFLQLCSSLVIKSQTVY